MFIFIHVKVRKLTVKFDGCKYTASINGQKYEAALLSQLIDSVPDFVVDDYWLNDFEYSV